MAKVNVECVVFTAATAAGLKAAYDAWRNQWLAMGNEQDVIVVSCAMFGVTDLIVFFIGQQ